MNTLLLGIPALLLGLLCLPGTVELLLVTLGAAARRPSSRNRNGERKQRRDFALAILVPAHNEASGIGSTVAHLLERAHEHNVPVIVIADNCSDATAAIAGEAGAAAEVWIRDDLSDRGKAAALRFAFRRLEQRGGIDGVLVLDADSRIAADLIPQVQAALASGADAVQCRNVVANAGTSPRTALLALALTAFNLIRPLGRAAWGLSAGPLANGFALPLRTTLHRVPFAASSIVEDLEYHLMLTAAGLRVRFLDNAVIHSEMPAGGAGAASQRARWEGGRWRMVRTWVPRLSRNLTRATAEPLLELLTMPLGLHGVILLAWLLLAAATGSPWMIAAAALSLAILAAHVGAAIVAMDQPAVAARGLAFAPFYVLWKLAVTPRTWRSAGAAAVWTEKRNQQCR